MYRLISTGFVACTVALSMAGCRKPAATPELQTTSGVQPLQQPVVVAGCLKSGVADNTFVLTAVEGTDTATYQLIARADQNLRDHVGERIEVSGTLRSQQQIEGTSGAIQEKPAK